MIDYTKILVKNIDINLLLKTLEFKIEVSEKTGLISTKRVAEYHFCKVVIYDTGVVLFTGSIHKLYNSLNGIKAPNHKESKQYKGFNGNQFTINNIFEVREHLTNLFDCTPQQMIFQNIEFGVNTTPLFNPQKFITGLLFHNGKGFEYRYNGHFSQVVHQRYILKIYNKSNQYKMDEYTLRVELKIVKIEDIKKVGIKTFADVNKQTLNKAKELLLKRFNEVVYYDYTINKENLTKCQKQTLNNYSNPRYWTTELTPKNRVYNKNKLRDFISNYSDNLHQQIRANLIQKFGIINQLFENYLFGIINHSSIGLNIPNEYTEKQDLNNVRFCSITGVDISMQKEDSFLLSHTGLKHLFITDKIKYDEVKTKHLSKKWIGTNLDIEIREIAHNIRDTVRNQRTKQIRLYPTEQIQLFNIGL